ncbi:IclR family transcriptional regulator [Novosphingobium colocasiae]|nr:IclR family transcriptional regulator [Novosphingobium colocasiae]
MRTGTPTLSSFGRVMALLDAILADGGRSGISELARGHAVPVATAHRHVVSLVEEGLLTPVGGGRHVAGPRLIRLGAAVDLAQVLARIAAPLLPGLARDLGAVVQLGTLENDMVTYRVKAGNAASGLFTQVGGQLEAYCSGIGKVLLAGLPEADRERYLANGPFIALTGQTITAPEALAAELAVVARDGYAFDREEIAEGLACAAVPVCDRAGAVVAALSASGPVHPGRYEALRDRIGPLKAMATRIEAAAFGAADR